MSRRETSLPRMVETIRGRLQRTIAYLGHVQKVIFSPRQSLRIFFMEWLVLVERWIYARSSHGKLSFACTAAQT